MTNRSWEAKFSAKSPAAWEAAAFSGFSCVTSAWLVTLPPTPPGMALPKLLLWESRGALGCWWDWSCPCLLSPLREELVWGTLKDGVLDLTDIFG